MQPMRDVHVVTGASKGIGRAIVEELVVAGRPVIAVARTLGALEGLKKDLPHGGELLSLVSSDLGDRGSYQELIADIGILSGGSIWGLVNCAGVLSDADLANLTDEEWSDTLGLNLGSVYRLSQGLLSLFPEETGGSIVNIASIHALVGFPNRAAYSASKGAILALSRQMAIELAPKNITVNVVSPGAIATSMNAHLRENVDYLEMVSSKIPLGRFGEAGEVASMVRFLLSEKARYITGQNFVIDGGWSAS